MKKKRSLWCCTTNCQYNYCHVCKTPTIKIKDPKTGKESEEVLSPDNCGSWDGSIS